MHIFDSLEFKGEYKEFDRVRNGCVKLDNNRIPKKVNKSITNGNVNPTFNHEQGV